MRLPFVVVLSFFCLTIAFPQEEAKADSIRAQIRKATDTDYHHMLKQLGISHVRPGVNGSDPLAENAVNYDEAKANPFPDYPDPLFMENGESVGTPKQWETQRRPELLSVFDKEFYGKVPQNTPSLLWKKTRVTTTKEAGIPVVVKELRGMAGYKDIQVAMEVSLVVPAKAEKPVPVMAQFIFVFPPWVRYQPAPDAQEWKKLLLQQGWGYAEIKPTSLQADNGAGLTSGIIGIVNKGHRRTPEQWGSIRAWAWGASQFLDYLETDADVDETRVGISGHSRYGKAALVTMANDPRFAIAYISSSGAGGASPFRRNYGEVLENVAGAGEYHWMAGNFIKYAGPLNWNDLPADAHSLIALCAPRPVFIGSGAKGDEWTDPRGMFLAAVKAGPVYELLGKKSLGNPDFPEVESSLIDGDVAFRQHSGGHTQAPNWPTFIQFAGKYFH